MLVYKIDLLKSLKEKGYNTTRLRRDKLMGENNIQYIRENKMVGSKAIDTLCRLLNMQPGDIIEYVDDDNSTD